MEVGRSKYKSCKGVATRTEGSQGQEGRVDIPAREGYRCLLNSADTPIKVSPTQRTKLDVTSLHVPDPGPEACPYVFGILPSW